jgi:hypothetical protein
VGVQGGVLLRAVYVGGRSWAGRLEMLFAPSNPVYPVVRA